MRERVALVAGRLVIASVPGERDDDHGRPARPARRRVRRGVTIRLCEHLATMPRYLVERRLGAISDAELEDAAQTSQRIRERDFPAVGWEHSHVVRDDGQLVSYCVYEAPDTQSVRDHAAAAGLPADRVLEIHADLRPDEL